MSQAKKEQIYDEITELLLESKRLEKRINTLWEAFHKIPYGKPESVHVMNKSRRKSIGQE